MKFPLEPDRTLLMPQAWDVGFLIFGGTTLAVFLVIALRHIYKERNPLLLFLLVGAFAGEMLEPICNVLGMAYHPEDGQIVGFETLGRKIPLWLMLIYPWYFAGFSNQLIRWEKAGVLTNRRYWQLFGLSALFCFAIEIYPVQAVLWDYYGPQPLTFFGMPLAWYVVNPTSDIATAAFSVLVVRNRTGWAQWPVMITMPICIVGFHTGVFAPLYMTMNAGWSETQSVFAFLITTAFAAVLLTTFSRLLFAGQTVASKASGVGESVRTDVDAMRAPSGAVSHQ